MTDHCPITNVYGPLKTGERNYSKYVVAMYSDYMYIISECSKVMTIINIDSFTSVQDSIDLKELSRIMLNKTDKFIPHVGNMTIV